MQTVAQMFEKYRRVVLPRSAPAVQVDECRRAFYAGVAAVLIDIANSPDDLNDVESERQTLELLDEVANFSRTRT